MAEYVTCPACGSKVLTADALLGRRVRCSGCGFRFVAAPDLPAPEPPPEVPPARPRLGDDEDEDEDLPFCPGCGRRVTWEASACPHCGEEFEEESRPERPFRLDVALPVRRDGEPHRGGLLLALGTLSAFAGAFSPCLYALPALVSVPLGMTVWVLATRDLRRMADGSVDPRGEKLTRHARSGAAAGVAFGLVLAGVYGLLWLAG